MPLLNNVNAVLFTKHKTQVVELTKIDLIHSEQHRLKYQSTNFPIEDGSNISDNVIKEPEEITLRGVTSNINVLDGIFNNFSTLSRPHDAWQQIKNIADSKQIVTVFTILNTYEDMIITSAQVPEISRTTGQNLIFELTLEQAPTVQTAIGNITADKTGSTNNPAKNMTDQVDNGDKQTNKSLLDRLL